MTKKSNISVRYSKIDLEILIKVLQCYVNETIDILGHKCTVETARYIDPVLTQLKRRWGTSEPQIIAAAMYNYGYIEGIRAERARRKQAAQA